MRVTLLTGVFVLIAGASALPEQEFRDKFIQGRTDVVSKEQPDINITTAVYPRNTTINAYTRQSDGSTQPEHVDTINNTTGVYSTKQVQNAKLQTFCPSTNKTQELCDNLQALVNLCVDEQAECSADEARELLDAAIESKPCNKATKGPVINKLCYKWWRSAKHCQKRERRGSCGHHHILYLLAEFRGLLPLPNDPKPNGTHHSKRPM
ncbi:hypothetical protein BS50DRAFT_53904 [Corynespora cassiicola Philippines]|uniref:Extracellular membrane protein CFEM domain-containing protein n=1 Tax=Corynespora cassiicola Philippines TaxID=1448308 RepID=A0A2T2NJ16_CORCC|nr:hypothetical protein BS50DRAFT_53904 [Corynespora cassiicola Philippines]